MKKEQKVKTFTIRRSALLILAALYLMVGFLGGVIFKGMESEKFMEMRELMIEQGAKAQMSNLEKRQSKLTTSMWKAISNANDPKPWVNLSKLYRENGKFNDALRALNRALAAAPKNENIKYLKGEIYLKNLDNPEAAFDTWEELLRQNPDARSPEGDKIENILRRARKKKK